MSIEKQIPENRTPITIAVVLVVCAIGLAYSQGWFDWSSPAAETEINNVSTSQALGQEETQADVLQVTKTASEPAATTVE